MGQNEQVIKLGLKISVILILTAVAAFFFVSA
jgi:hypothetical protein